MFAFENLGKKTFMFAPKLLLTNEWPAKNLSCDITTLSLVPKTDYRAVAHLKQKWHREA